MTKGGEMPAAVSIKNVTYTYEGEEKPVLKDLSMDFREGEIHAVCGPSGCGKSTVLYLISGLIPHMYEGNLQGRVCLFGEDVTDTFPHERCDRIGLVMQNPDSQFCSFTVEEELAFGLENLGMEASEMQERIEETLSLTGLTGYEMSSMDHLSGGQKQKVAIAAVLAMRPRIMLLDEPTANLDPENRRMIFSLITELPGKFGITVILVEHHIDEIITEVDHLYLLDESGSVISDGKGTDERNRIEELSRRAKEEAGEFIPTKPTEEVLLSVRNLKFAYPLPGNKKGPEILRGVSFDLKKQEFLAITGINGSGKTTLMNLLFKMYQPDSGDIVLYGRSCGKWKKKDLYRTAGLVFQNPEDQFIGNSVMEEMMFSLKKEKMTIEEKKARSMKMLRRFHLEGDCEKSPFVLSQGQKRRLSVAAMLLTDQKILFLDEPTFGQDQKNRHMLMRDMQKLIRDGVTVVMITHDMELVREYATRVIEIRGGKIDAATSKEEEDVFIRSGRFSASPAESCL